MYLDILVVAILLITIFKGYLNGFFLETLSFFGVIINIIFSKTLTPILILRFEINPDSPLYSGVYALVFLAVYLVMGLFIMLIKRTLKKAFKGRINTLAGAMLGLLKGILISFVVLLFYTLLSMNIGVLKKYGDGSYSRRTFIYSLPVIREYFPREYGEKLQKLAHSEKIERYLNNILKE